MVIEDKASLKQGSHQLEEAGKEKDIVQEIIQLRLSFLMKGRIRR